MVRLIINGIEYFGFNVNNLSLPYNTIASTFSFSGLKNYTPTPLTFPKVEIYIDNALILTGTIVNQEYESTEKPTLVSVSGYSLAGILEDCTIPKSAMPMEFDNMSLKEICDKLIPLYNLKYTMENSVKTLMNKKFEKVNFNYDRSIKSIIVSLAKERGIYVNHLENGNVHFTDSSTDNLEVVEHFEDNGVTKMYLNIDGQSIHSSITVLTESNEEDIVEGEYTLSNPYVKISRPLIVRMSSGDYTDGNEYVRFLVGSELRSIQLKISSTKFIKPGNIISVTSEKLHVPENTVFFIEKTEVKNTTTGDTYEYDCVLKDCYSKKKIKNIFE